jgi:hypothetical protein
LLNDTYERDCIVYVKANDTILSVSPEPVNIEGIGLVSSFRADKCILNGYYSQFMMRPDQEYGVTIKCGPDMYNMSVVPVLKGLQEVGGMGVWFRDNGGMVLGVLLGLALLLGILVLILKMTGVIT